MKIWEIKSQIIKISIHPTWKGIVVISVLKINYVNMHKLCSNSLLYYFGKETKEKRENGKANDDSREHEKEIMKTDKQKPD